MLHTVLLRLLLLLALAAGLPACSPGAAPDAPQAAQGLLQPSHAGLPAEAIETLALIQRGGPFPYRKDGTTFQNRERLLPARPRGYYREYTVPTPGARDRGARRIVSGGDPPEVFYYTADHYRSFREIAPLRSLP
ncbi:MAG TPA: ribonuclease domain-containing protein [Thauera aminoaromatica]|nr:ribonuclease [Thauera sp.]HMV93942.1 ribonuclease domain-containing protein [Thauera aminoaromatica]HMY77920.1 ribonuclease domain-containing protein [Thauera aminoaromatica]HNH63581.1 ribonuclease domain-containing protein [Thauera aminoaromatica]HRG72049.1 ribonuclease domain-containing protein [Thauera aminoaromatica]